MSSKPSTGYPPMPDVPYQFAPVEPPPSPFIGGRPWLTLVRMERGLAARNDASVHHAKVAVDNDAALVTLTFPMGAVAFTTLELEKERQAHRIEREKAAEPAKPEERVSLSALNPSIASGLTVPRSIFGRTASPERTEALIADLSRQIAENVRRIVGPQPGPAQTDHHPV